ncbi:MAG TPA: rhomboid family intramembrane serine protease [Vicinamibacteria bacterium]|nr:rhomboid family intramembrane serine protease [Vicinamibacteria bacterium]
MFLPIGDQPNPRGTPIVNYAIIGLNIAVFLLLTVPLSLQAADPSDPRFRDYVDVIGQNLPPGVPLNEIARQVSAYDLVVFSYGYRPAEPSIVALFTAMFLHGGFLHLFGNMLFLWIYGDNVEHRLGSVPYLFWYLTTGVAATLFHAIFASDSPIPLVGASGAISGVLGFYFIWFPHNQVRILVFFFFVNVILLPARWVLGFYILIDNILPFIVSQSDGAGVAHGAHIGGFLAGLGAAWFKNRRIVTERPPDYRGVQRQGPRSPADEIREAIRRNELATAAERYFELSSEQTRRLLGPNESILLGNWLAQNSHPRAALTIYQRHLRDYPTGPGAAEAHAYAGLVQLHAFDEPTAAYQHLIEALDFDPSPELRNLVRNGLDLIESRQKYRIRARRRH